MGIIRADRITSDFPSTLFTAECGSTKGPVRYESPAERWYQDSKERWCPQEVETINTLESWLHSAKKELSVYWLDFVCALPRLYETSSDTHRSAVNGSCHWKSAHWSNTTAAFRWKRSMHDTLDSRAVVCSKTLTVPPNITRRRGNIHPKPCYRLYSSPPTTELQLYTELNVAPPRIRCDNANNGRGLNQKR